MEAIRFEKVSRSFRQGRPLYVKEALLGSRGVRAQSRVTHAVNDLSFSVDSGEAVALLGHNGSGKSTTLKLLARVLTPTSGRVLSRGRIAPLLQLGSGFHPDLTGRENVYLNAAILGMERRRIIARMDDIVSFAGLEDHIDMPVRFYSTGMNARLGFAIAINVEPEIMLIDEVLAVGDNDFQVRCLERMQELKQDGRTMILVTHSLAQAQSFCTRAIVLDHGNCTYDGAVSDAQEPFAASTRTH